MEVEFIDKFDNLKKVRRTFKVRRTHQTKPSPLPTTHQLDNQIPLQSQTKF